MCMNNDDLNEDLFFFSKDVVFQEVPNEISLSFAIAGCSNNCKNCSWKNIKMQQKPLSATVFENYLKKYQGLVSCVVFLGGEWKPKVLINRLKKAKEYGFKTCLYTGKNDVSEDIKKYLDYLKTGPYIEELGGLTSEKTNQKFIDVITGKILNNYFRHCEAI